MADWDVVGEETLGGDQRKPEAAPKPNADPWSVVAEEPLVNPAPAALSAAGRNPASVAKADRDGRQFGLPADVVERNPAEIERLRLADEASKLPPRTAEWVAKNPNNAAASRDDWGILSTLETVFKTNPITAPMVFWLDQDQPNPVKAGKASFTRMFGSAIEGAAEVPGMIQRNQDRMTLGVAGLFGSEFQQRIQENMQARDAASGDYSLDRLIQRGGAAVGGRVNEIADWMDVPAEDRDWIDEIGGGLGSALAFMGVGALTGGTGVAVMGGGVGIDQQADEAREAGVYGTLDGDNAMATGAAVSAVTESIGFKWLTRALPEPARRFLASRVADIVLSGAGEATQEALENTTHNLITQTFIDPNHSAFEGVADASGVGFAVGLIMRGGVHVAHAQTDAASAVAENATLQEIMKVSGGSKLFQSSPELFREAVASLKTSGMEDVYVPVNDWRTLFQSGQDSDGARAAAGVSDADFAAALTTGGRVRIPTERFLTAFNQEQQAALAKNARFQPDGLLPEEARTFDPKSAMQEYLARAQYRPAGRDNEVYDEYVARLTGPYTRQEAEALAESVAAFVRGFGGRAGMVDELVNLLVERTGVRADVKLPKSVQQVLSTRRDVVPAIDSVLDMIRTREFPKDRDLYGPSLSEAVRSWGGIDPAAFGAGDLAAMDAQRQQIFRADGLTLEDALVRAVQDGYINKGLLSESDRYDTNAADLNDLIEALTKDMHGVSPVYSPQFENRDRQALVAAAEDLARELDDKGIDLAKVDNATARRQLGWFVDEPAAADPDQDTLFQSEPAEADLRDPDRRWYYSATVQAVASSKLTKASGDQWLSTLRNMPGVKDDELAWLGVPEFLAGKKSVTRDELAEHVRQQQIIVEDTLLGSRERSGDWEEFKGGVRRKIGNRWIHIWNPDASGTVYAKGPSGYMQRFDSIEAAQDHFDGIDAASSTEPARYRGMVLPGGKQYRELLLRMPTDATRLRAEGDRISRLENPTPEEVETFRRANTAGSLEYRSSHFDQPNILAHVRFDERTDANGNRVLFVQEVQSDWGQEGKKKGFGVKPVDQQGAPAGWGNTDTETGVPSAPFVTSTRAWVALAVKRMVAYAVENGYHSVAFPTPELVPQIENWGTTLDEIKNDPADSKRFGAILSRYADDIPRAVRALAKKYGGRVVEADLGDNTAAPQSVAGVTIPNVARIIVPSIEITPELRAAAMAGLPLFQRNRGKRPRGSLTITDQRQFIMELGKARDWSTFLHESAHLYLEAIREVDASLRARDPATLTAEQLRVLADNDTVLGFLGATSFDAITRDQHEVWAETYEAYLREGKAPSTRLQSAFQKFSAWLKLIYRTLAGLPNQKLAPDIRAVFDRMLATEAEIAEAASLQGFVPKFADAASAGMTDDEYQRYLEAIEVARRAAEDAEMRRQYQFLNQANKQWFRDELARVRQELSDELNDDPVYRAVAQMRYGTLPDGSPLPDGVRQVKMNSQSLIDRYGWPFVRKHFSRMHASDGASPDVVARAMGFESADAMIDRIVNTQPRTAYLNARTAQIMSERYPDPMASPDAALQAAAAVNNEAAEQVLIREIVALGGNREMAHAMKDAARRIVAATSVRDLKPYKHQVAQERAGREAIKSIAAGSKTEGLRALREQLMAGYLLRESRDAMERSERIRAEAVRLGKKPAQERLAKAGDDYLANMNLLLGTYEFRRVSNKELSRRAGLRRWVEAMQEAGEVTAFTDDLLARVEAERVTNWRQVTVRELEELGEAMANLSHLAGLKNKLLSARQSVEYDEAVTALVERIEQTFPQAGPDVVDDADLGKVQRAGEKVSKFFGELTRPEAWIEALDGGESGPWHDFIWWPQERSEDKIKGLQKRVGGMLKALHKSLPKDFWGRADEDVTIRAQSGEVTITRYTLMSMVLNKGNAGNRQRLRDGGITSKFGKVYQLTDAEVDSLPGLLTEAELRYVQGLWDVASSMRPEIEQTTRELAGIPVEFVEAVPFEVRTADGAVVQMRGGYWPLVYHADRSRAGDRQSGDDALKVIMGMGFTSAFTSKGYTKNRVEKLREPLRLNLGYVLAKNLNDVMIDVSYRKTVRDVQRLLKDPRIRSAIVARAGDSAYRAINGGLAYSVSANGDAVEATARTIGGASDFLMSNAAVSILGIRPDIALGNYGSSLVQGLTRVDKLALLRGMRKLYLDKGDLREKMAELSPFMVNRLEDGDYFYRQELAKTNQKMGFRAAYARVMMTLHRIADNQATQALWWGRFDQEVRNGADPAEAARLADTTIRMTQTANSRKDLAVFERDTQFKQSRMFMGPMMVQFAQIRKAATGDGLEGWGARLALGWNALFVAPAIFALLAGRWPEDDDDDGLDAEDWALWVAANTGVIFFMQTVPMLREAAAAAEQVMSDRPVNPRAAPTAQAVAQMVKSGKALAKEFGEDDPDYWKMTGDLVHLTAPVTAFPASQFKRYQRSVKWIEENPEASLQMQAQVMLYGPPR